MADQGPAGHLTKPHFLQPVVSDIATNFSIPADFCKYLEAERCNKFQLRSRRRTQPWVVRIEGWRMGDGWEKFVKENELQVGEFLVFRYEGNMVFDVTVFNPTACERECPPPVDESGAAVKEGSGTPTHETEENADITRQRQPYSSSRVGTSSFMGRMRPSYMKNLYFPITFVLEHELLRTNSGILIKDENGRTWPMEIHVRRDSNVVYTKKRGWRSFIKENGLLEGDEFEIRVVTKGITPVLAFHRINVTQTPRVFQQESTRSASEVSEPETTMVPEQLRRHKVEEIPEQSTKVTSVHAKKPEEMASMPATKLNINDKKPGESHNKEKTDSSSAGSSTHFFFQTSTWPSLKQSRMNVNIEFARANDLPNRCGDIILKNLKGELWAAKLRYKRVRSCDCYYIGAGWKKFALSNGLGVGCRFKMEIEKPETEVLTMKLCG